MAKQRRPAIDDQCHVLAEHFMATVRGHTKAQVQELAEAFQAIAEMHCSMAEDEITDTDNNGD